MIKRRYQENCIFFCLLSCITFLYASNSIELGSFCASNYLNLFLNALNASAYGLHGLLY